MLTFPNRAYISGDHSVATPVTPPEFSAPFADFGVNVYYLFAQDFQIQFEAFAPLALDTPHYDADLAAVGFVLVKEGDRKDQGGGMVRWTRTYARVPDDFSRPGGTYNYNFPALVDVAATARPVLRLNVGCRILREFFHTNNGLTIPVIDAQRFVLLAHLTVDATAPSGYPAVADLTATTEETVPSLTTYRNWIAGGTEFVAEAAKLEQWHGNIWLRSTIYVTAK